MKKSFPVRPEKVRDLYLRMEALGISEEDFDEHFIRCPGRGGQKVNKTSSGVYLRHRSSGMEVKCCSERTQALNRFLARRLLVERMESERRGGTMAIAGEPARIRKQKDRRKRRRQHGTEAAPVSCEPSEGMKEADE